MCYQMYLVPLHTNHRQEDHILDFDRLEILKSKTK